MFKTTKALLLLSLSMLLMTACEGVMGGIYDEPTTEVKVAEGQLYIDASSWTEWYYIDLKALAQAAATGDSATIDSLQTHFPHYTVPQTLTGEWDGESRYSLHWFDIWGAGVEVDTLVSTIPADRQPEPDSWTLAIHRDNVRTNGCAAFETSYTSIDNLPSTSTLLMEEEAQRLGVGTLVFTEDTLSTSQIWVNSQQMLNCLVGCQVIGYNAVLSNWLRLKIPPMPPAFTHNANVFLLRLPDGSYAALQLANYKSPSGTNCCMTINYRYPY